MQTVPKQRLAQTGPKKTLAFAPTTLGLIAAACASDARPDAAETQSEAPASTVASSSPASGRTMTSTAPAKAQLTSSAASSLARGAGFENGAEEALDPSKEGETKIWPEGFDARMRAAAERAERGAFEEALGLYGAASELRPGHAMPHIERARIHIDRGHHGAAREHAERGVEIYPTSSLAWNTLGRVKRGEGDLEAAAEAFREAATLNENNSYAWNNLGLSLLELGRYGDAADALEVATSGLEPEAYMWNNLGMAYEYQGDLVRARASYRLGMKLGSLKAETNLDRLEGVSELPGIEEPGLNEPGV